VERCEGDYLGYYVYARGPQAMFRSDLSPDLDYELFRTSVDFQERGTHLPAVMNMRAYRSQIDKIEKRDVQIHARSYRKAKMFVSNVIRRFCPTINLLTQRQALDGITDSDGVLEPLDFSTSPGSLFSREFKTKRELIDEQPLLFDSWCKFDWNCTMAGHTVLWPARHSLKTEKREFNKVVCETASTRLFAASCFPQVVTCRRLFGDFIRKFYANHGKFFSAVGMDVYAGGWQRLILDITRGGKHTRGFEFDVVKLDKNMRRKHHMAFAKLMCKMTADQKYRNAIRVAKARDARACSISPEGYIFCLDMTNPSGDVDTVVVNTYILAVSVTYSFFRMCKKLKVKLLSYEMLQEIVHHYMYGDDFFGAFHPGFEFDAELFSNLMGSLLFEVEIKCGSILERSFLGRRTFVFSIGDRDFLIPYLAFGRILAIPEFGKSSGLVEKLSRAMAARALAFAWCFGGRTDLYVLMDMYVDYLFEVYSADPSLSLCGSKPGPHELFIWYTGCSIGVGLNSLYLDIAKWQENLSNVKGKPNLLVKELAKRLSKEGVRE
jgi:hypothetical protein